MTEKGREKEKEKERRRRREREGVKERNRAQERKREGERKKGIGMPSGRVCCLFLCLSCVYFLNYVEQNLFCRIVKKHLGKRIPFKEVQGLSVKTQYACKVLARHFIEFLSRHYLNCFHMAQVFFIKTRPLRYHIKKGYQISLALSDSQIPLGFKPISLSALSV